MPASPPVRDDIGVDRIAGGCLEQQERADDDDQQHEDAADEAPAEEGDGAGHGVAAMRMAVRRRCRVLRRPPLSGRTSPTPGGRLAAPAPRSFLQCRQLAKTILTAGLPIRGGDGRPDRGGREGTLTVEAEHPVTRCASLGKMLARQIGIRPVRHRPARIVGDVADRVARDGDEAPLGDVDQRQVGGHLFWNSL